MPFNAIVLIRSAQERTVEYCKFLLKDQVGVENIIIVEESPFSESVRKSFQLGIEYGRKWTICVDADVFVKKGAVQELIDFAETLDENVFEVQGTFIDKFIPIRRTGAIHLYRTRLLPEALPLIPPEGSSLRPESTTIKEMVKKGYSYVLTDILVGIHDFEQYYEDIYRKCYTHAHKHKLVLAQVEKHWDQLGEIDSDYLVASLGCMAGKVYNGTVYIDKNFVKNESKHVLALKNISEKIPIDPSAFDPDIVKKVMDSFSIDQEIQSYIFPPERWSQYITHKRKSFLRSTLASAVRYTGLGFEKTGNTFKKWAAKI